MPEVEPESINDIVNEMEEAPWWFQVALDPAITLLKGYNVMLGQGDLSRDWDLGLEFFGPGGEVAEGLGVVAKKGDAIGDLIRTHKHHMVPLEILRKYLPKKIANAPKVRGVRGSPNRWPVPVDKHIEIHRGPGGGAFNEMWKQELESIKESGKQITVSAVLDIRDRLAVIFDLERYRP